MHPKEPEIEFKVYNKLTRLNDNEKSHSKWTLNLFCCCLVVAMASLQFGYNISSMNSATSILKKFISREFILFAEFKTKSDLFALNEGYLLGNQSKYDNGLAEYEFKKGKYAESRFSLNLTEREEYDRMRVQSEREYREKYNMTVEEYLSNANKTLNEKRATLEGYRVKLAEAEIKVNKATDYIWTITNCLFVVGGMTGTFTSKFLMDIFGRKKAILIHHMFSILAAALVLASSMFLSPVCVIFSRFLFGVQGGMSCTLVPTYLAEISPAALRGRTGVVHQLFITIGIVVAQVLGFRQIFASQHLWWALLAMPAVPAIIGFVLFLIFMPESPRALLGKDEDSTRAALVFLRNSELVEAELEELISEAKGSPETNTNDTLSAIDLFKQHETFWPILTSLALHVTQQLSGINAIFFYSSSIFKDAGISDEYVQYAILSTGIVNVITTIVCVPLIDKLGRKPLLIYPMIFMIIDFICLILLLTLKGDNMILSYLSILCIMLFVISFAIGLGPIPFIYTAECFRQNARSSAMALSTLTNWSSGLLLTLIFPSMLAAIQQYVFIFFLGVVLLAVILIINKVPETKGKSIEEIIAKFTNFKTQF